MAPVLKSLKVSDLELIITYVTYLMLVVWLVKALFHFAGITGGLLEGFSTTLFRWREVDLSLRYQGKWGGGIMVKRRNYSLGHCRQCHRLSLLLS